MRAGRPNKKPFLIRYAVQYFFCRISPPFFRRSPLAFSFFSATLAPAFVNTLREQQLLDFTMAGVPLVLPKYMAILFQFAIIIRGHYWAIDADAPLG